MARLEDLVPGASVRGVAPGTELVTVERVRWSGSAAIELIYKDSSGAVDNQLLYREDEPRLEVVQVGRPWSFDGDGADFRLVSEAKRILLAHLFDPLLAVNTSLVEPLPHQITAVYEAMLPRQPLRFLLADDPGAGKTIMAGLLIRELMARGDVRRCLVVCPGSLVEQWQQELGSKFQLPFDIATADGLRTAHSGNWFSEHDLVIARLDQLARNPDLHVKLQAPDAGWDLVVCDEAHKMSASYSGGEISQTKRYQLGRLLSGLTRHLLLMTATPHNGKDADFQLFMKLLDGDRFEGRFRDGVHKVDVSDLMRRMVKERLLTFEGTPLFPERRAFTVPCQPSDDEARLYRWVTEYVRHEFNRADALQNDGRRRTVGFALTVLQRRLASSPAALSESLRRRRERLVERLAEVRRGRSNSDPQAGAKSLDADDLEDLDDLDDLDDDLGQYEILDAATAARTIEELEAEIHTLRQLEDAAAPVRQAGDTKWHELSAVLCWLLGLDGATAGASPNSPATGANSDGSEVFSVAAAAASDLPPKPAAGQKIVIFTEHRDTLDYLWDNIANKLLGRQAVTMIHGGLSRRDRQRAQERFLWHPKVQVLLATDAASEGINLQRAHLMVNYDLPWNPNRLEQRFGRIHRIGQSEVCHLWNLVADGTREGDVYRTLLDKLESARKALGGQVFDVLGRLEFDGRPLRELLIEAVRYGDESEVRANLDRVISDAVDQPKLTALMEDRALATEVMDTSRVAAVREDMERAQARRLQPHYIESCFAEAFTKLGGRSREHESRRIEITHVPVTVRDHARTMRSGDGRPVVSRYERATFEKDFVTLRDEPLADFLCPGHPLVNAVLDLTLERDRDLLRRGTVLVDDSDAGTQPRVLFYAEHEIGDATSAPSGERRTISKRMLYVEMNAAGQLRLAQHAPYLDYRPLREGEPTSAELLERSECAWISGELEDQVRDYVVAEAVPAHLDDVRARRTELIEKTRAAVKDRLTKEINHQDHRAERFAEQARAGKQNARLNETEARRQADDLHGRLRGRLSELDQQLQIRPRPPVVLGGLLVVPAGLLAAATGSASNGEAPTPEDHAAVLADRQAAAARAREAVMVAERQMGFEPTDREFERLGYDIESRDPATGKLRFIEVKGRVSGAATITVTKNEILHSLNQPESYILAMVEFMPDDSERVHYLRRPFNREPDFGVTSVNYHFDRLLARAGPPS